MSKRRAVFLDRDGTLIREADYLADPDGVELLPGVPDALRRLRAGGLALVIVTNQSGIARGLYTEDDYRRVAARLTKVLASEGASVDATFRCPHHPEHSGQCPCRKPGLGMHREAADLLGLDLACSYFVGDKLSDVEAARAAGGQGILVRTGYGASTESSGGVPPEVIVVDSLVEVSDWILAREAVLRAGSAADPRVDRSGGSE
jgi:D-glycero-D-manno-heptose 1,7-bisphosphate phosphatase